MPSPHRVCKGLLQHLPGNPVRKIMSKSGNPDDFRKIYLEIMAIVMTTRNLVKLHQKYLEMWSKTVDIF